MEITIIDQQKKVPLKLSSLRKIVKTILHKEGIVHASLSFVFVTHQKIRALNRKYLHHDYATDTIAFDNQERDSKTVRYPSRRKKAKSIAGDIVISTDAVLRCAPLYGVSLQQELVLYMIHGLLHLMGFNDHHAQEIEKMRKKEKEILAFLGRRINGTITTK